MWLHFMKIFRRMMCAVHWVIGSRERLLYPKLLCNRVCSSGRISKYEFNIFFWYTFRHLYVKIPVYTNTCEKSLDCWRQQFFIIYRLIYVGRALVFQIVPPEIWPCHDQITKNIFRTRAIQIVPKFVLTLITLNRKLYFSSLITFQIRN